nr:TPA_asm: ATP8 [Bombus melanopygus]
MNWLIIFLMCLMNLFIIIILMNSLLLMFNMKNPINNKNKHMNYLNKKWKWSW